MARGLGCSMAHFVFVDWGWRALGRERRTGHAAHAYAKTCHQIINTNVDPVPNIPFNRTC